ncbi:MAG TPA: MarR family winged helix-turn-helix transcriptional regulator [Candidatus Binatia bacterium]
MPRRPAPPPDAAQQPLEQRIVTALHKLGLAMKQQTWLQASDEGLSPTQGQILATLATDGPQSATELSRRLGLTLPTISDSVRVLAEKGLIARKPDPRHPRASLLSLTARGRTRATRAQAWPEFLAAAVGTLSEGEREAVFGALVKMIRTLQENGQIPPSRMCVSCTYFRPNVHAGPRPHHCALVDAPMRGTDLRLDCAEHEEASAEQRRESWERLVNAG